MLLVPPLMRSGDAEVEVEHCEGEAVECEGEAAMSVEKKKENQSEAAQGKGFLHEEEEGQVDRQLARHLPDSDAEQEIPPRRRGDEAMDGQRSSESVQVYPLHCRSPPPLHLSLPLSERLLIVAAAGSTRETLVRLADELEGRLALGVLVWVEKLAAGAVGALEVGGGEVRPATQPEHLVVR